MPFGNRPYRIEGSGLRSLFSCAQALIEAAGPVAAIGREGTAVATSGDGFTVAHADRSAAAQVAARRLEARMEITRSLDT
jgi:hypothetical protein